MPAPHREPLDLRLAPAALAGWASAAVGLGWTPARALVSAGLLWLAGFVVLQRLSPGGARRRELAAVLALLVAGAAMGAAGLRADADRAGPLGALASEGASVHLSG